MKILVVVTPPSIYHGCSTQKTLWEEKFTGKKDLFQSENMKNCGCRKVPYVKKIPKHEPTSSYYNLVRCITDFMMRSDEHNCHVHGSYEEETDPSLNVNVTDKDESK